MFEEVFLQAMSHAGQSDSVSPTGAQICSDGNITTARLRLLWLKAACGQELDLISGGGNSGLHLKGGAGEGARTTINTISSVK